MVGYLASLQASIAGLPELAGQGVASQLGGLAAWNAIAAVLSIVFGAGLLVRPGRGLLGASALWAAVTVLWNGYGILNGATHWAYVGATIAALVAGATALSARSGWPEDMPPAAVLDGDACAKCRAALPEGVMVGRCPSCAKAFDRRPLDARGPVGAQR